MSQSKVHPIFLILFCAACGSTAGDPSGPAGGGGGGAGGSGAAGATGGSGGSVECTARCGSAGCPPCAGPAMIAATTPEGNAYRIDTTEVTNAHYAQFLAAAVDTAAQPADCSWNLTFVPEPSEAGCTPALYDPAQRADYPVVCVNWCDARAYCDWAGKRLCLHPGGTPSNGEASGEWVYACTANTTLRFPYGDTYDPTACNGMDSGIGKLAPVGSLAGCQGGLPGLYDMSGNALELAGSCLGDGPGAKCNASGGHYKHAENRLECFPVRSTPPRSFASNDLGFRCCADSLE
jgi:formylglycine-generating enzyme